MRYKEKYKMSKNGKDKLILDKEIEVVTSDNKKIIGKLEKIKYKGKEIYTYTLGLPEETLGHIWSKEERKRLYQGEEVNVDGFISDKTGKPFSGIAKWDSKGNKIILEDKSK